MISDTVCHPTCLKCCCIPETKLSTSNLSQMFWVIWTYQVLQFMQLQWKTCGVSGSVFVLSFSCLKSGVWSERWLLRSALLIHIHRCVSLLFTLICCRVMSSGADGRFRITHTHTLSLSLHYWKHTLAVQVMLKRWIWTACSIFVCKTRV